MKGKKGISKKIEKIIVGTLLVIALISFAGNVDNASGNSSTMEQLSSKMIRLHVVANSDSSQDQQLKLKVKDEIIHVLNKKFQEIDDICKSREYLKNNLETIETIARKVIKSEGKDYKVTARLGKFPFPIKNYGCITLPAGDYEALRVVIGKGDGANWWCVLFPPLCFVDITHTTAQDEAKLVMSNVLTSQEMKIIETAEKPKDVPFEIRFKLLDLWEEAKGKIDRTIRLAFK